MELPLQSVPAMKHVALVSCMLLKTKIRKLCLFFVGRKLVIRLS